MFKSFGGVFAALLLVSLASLFSACTSDSSSSSESVTGASGESVELNGTWVTDCIPQTDTTSDIITWKISGNEFKYTEDWYGTADCSDSSTFTYYAEGPEGVGDSVDVTWLNGEPPGSLDQTVSANLETTTQTLAEATWHGADAVNYANQNEQFGFTDWEDGVTKDILGVQSDGSEWDTEVLDLIFIDDTGDSDTWYSGVAGTEGADGYPTELWNDYAGVRQ